MRARKITILVLGAALALSAVTLVGAQANQGPDPRYTAPSSGPSGMKWIGGNRAGAFMNPGLACIACHAQGEGPRFAVAGTVYTKLNEKNLDLGVEAVTVQITDAKGITLTLKTNKSGNFTARQGTSISFPITAKIIFNGKTRAMGTPQSSGDCNTCHTSTGMGGAPGRIIIPG